MNDDFYGDIFGSFSSTFSIDFSESAKQKVQAYLLNQRMYWGEAKTQAINNVRQQYQAYQGKKISQRTRLAIIEALADEFIRIDQQMTIKWNNELKELKKK